MAIIKIAEISDVMHKSYNGILDLPKYALKSRNVKDCLFPQLEGNNNKLYSKAYAFAGLYRLTTESDMYALRVKVLS